MVQEGFGRHHEISEEQKWRELKFEARQNLSFKMLLVHMLVSELAETYNVWYQNWSKIW